MLQDFHISLLSFSLSPSLPPPPSLSPSLPLTHTDHYMHMATRSESSASEPSSDEEYRCSFTKKKPKVKKAAAKAKKEAKTETPKVHRLVQPLAAASVVGAEGGVVTKPAAIASFPPRLIQTEGQTLKEVALERVKLVKPTSKPVNKLEAPPLVRASPPVAKFVLPSDVRVVPGGGTMADKYRPKETTKAVPKPTPPSSLMKLPPQLIKTATLKSEPPPLVSSSRSRDRSHDPHSHAHSHLLQSPTTPVQHSLPTSSHPSHSHSHTHSHTHTHTQSHRTTRTVAIDPILLAPGSRGPKKSANPPREATPQIHAKLPGKSPQVASPKGTTIALKKALIQTQTPSMKSSAPPPQIHASLSPSTSHTVSGMRLPTTALPRIVTPLQLVSPPTHTHHQPHSITSPPGTVVSMSPSLQSQQQHQQNIGSRNLILLQRPSTSGISAATLPAYITQGGQMYKIVTSNAAGSKSSQKMSVIMQSVNPDCPGGETQYIAQLDGPPDTAKKPRTKKERVSLRRRFEKTKEEEQERLGLSSGSAVQANESKNSSALTSASSPQESASVISEMVSESAVQVQSPGSEKQVQDLCCSPGKKGQSAEDLMTEKLKFYLEREKERAKGLHTKPVPSEGSGSSSTSSSVVSAPNQRDLPLNLPPTTPKDSSPQKRVRKREPLSRCKSASPVSTRSSKQARLVVSTTLFSHVPVSGSQPSATSLSSKSDKKESEPVSLKLEKRNEKRRKCASMPPSGSSLQLGKGKKSVAPPLESCLFTPDNAPRQRQSSEKCGETETIYPSITTTAGEDDHHSSTLLEEPTASEEKTLKESAISVGECLGEAAVEGDGGTVAAEDVGGERGTNEGSCSTLGMIESLQNVSLNFNANNSVSESRC